MKEYELRIENSYGNRRIAGFEDLDILIKFTNDNPPGNKEHYYIIFIETKTVRHDLNNVIKILEAGNRHLL